MEFITPGKIIYGENSLEQAKKEIAKFGKKALIVTGKHLVKSGEIERLTNLLEEMKITYSIFSDVVGEPTTVMVEDGLNVYKSDCCDFIIAIGGGSPIDTMKAIAMLACNGGKCSEYMGSEITGDFPPMVAIPTTAGTGSEATTSTIITDININVKMLLKGASMMPNLAIVDSSFTLSAPKSVTAHTGLDALTHAIEAYTSKKAGALTDPYALSAVKRIFNNLPIVYQDGSDKTARYEMSIAALEAGIAFSNSSVTIVHGMSRPIGALFHVPHGLSNAMLLPKCLEFALDGAIDRFANLGRAIGIEGESDTCVANSFVEAVADLCKKCQIVTLTEYGIKKEEFIRVIPKMAEDALNSGSPANTRKSPTKEEIEELYKIVLNL